MSNVVDILSGCRLFAAVPPKSIQRLAIIARPCKFKKRQTIFREKEDCPGGIAQGTMPRV